jgi:two-component system, NtrC family, sensor kinase
MDTFVWSKRYLTGEALVDREHLELVRIINRVGEMQAQQPDQTDAIATVIGQLARYAVEHFAHEEALMRQSGCDARHTDLHHAIHEDFAHQVTLMSRDPHIKLDFLLRFLIHWLSYHILGIDQAMARQIGRIRSGLSPAAAYEAESQELTDPATASLLEALHGLYGVITQRNQELHEFNRTLEQQVAERTHALQQSNRQLAADIVRRETVEEELRERYDELQRLHQTLSQAQEQLVQQEKLASIGLLAAGVAHEINNPIGYVHSNLGTLESYLHDLFSLLNAYQAAERKIADTSCREALQALRQRIDFDFLKEDIPTLMRETREGIVRVKKIVQDLKDFSRVDSTPAWQWADLHRGIDSTINIIASEIRHKADIVREYGELPEIECLPMQLNQVFMNLLVNAAHAIEGKRGTITIRSGTADDRIWLEFADDGCGMSAEVRQKIFDPFFTTKPVGQGSGLGLSLCYGIVEQHHGKISVDSEPGHGTTFHIVLPIHHAPAATPAA